MLRFIIKYANLNFNINFCIMFLPAVGKRIVCGTVCLSKCRLNGKFRGRIAVLKFGLLILRQRVSINNSDLKLQPKINRAL